MQAAWDHLRYFIKSVGRYPTHQNAKQSPANFLQTCHKPENQTQVYPTEVKFAVVSSSFNTVGSCLSGSGSGPGAGVHPPPESVVLRARASQSPGSRCILTKDSETRRKGWSQTKGMMGEEGNKDQILDSDVSGPGQKATQIEEKRIFYMR